MKITYKCLKKVDNLENSDTTSSNEVIHNDEQIDSLKSDFTSVVENTFTYETIINYYTQGDSILLESNNFGSSFVDNLIKGVTSGETLIINPSNVNESAPISFNNAGYLTNINANYSGNLSFTFNSYKVEVRNIRLSVTGSGLYNESVNTSHKIAL